jgi:transcriptional regulator with XRE-family HTH domain
MPTLNDDDTTRRGGTRSGHPNPVDIHVGSRLRLRRTLLGMSQEKLADSLGLTFQQVQKYERGANRIGASRLHQLARILEVPVSFFFEEMAPSRSAGTSVETPDGSTRFGHDPMTRRETLELVRAYYRIPDEKVRKRIFEMVKAVAAASER